MPDHENGNGAAASDGSVQQVSELLDRLVMGSKDDPSELGYTVAVTGIAALEQVSKSIHFYLNWPKLKQHGHILGTVFLPSSQLL
jgi:hypothetical protein